MNDEHKNQLIGAGYIVLVGVVLAAILGVPKWMYSEGAEDQSVADLSKAVGDHERLLDGIKLAIVQKHPEVNLDLLRIAHIVDELDEQSAVFLATSMSAWGWIATRGDEPYPKTWAVITGEPVLTLGDPRWEAVWHDPFVAKAFDRTDVETLGQWYAEYSEMENPMLERPIPVATVVSWKQDQLILGARLRPTNR